MEKTDEALAAAIGAVSEALATATDTYGAATVELAMTVVWYEAARQVAVFAFFAVLCLLFVFYGVRACRGALCREGREADPYITATIGCFFGAVPSFTLALIEAPTPAVLAALFGRPEILIATQAMKSAGLL